MDPIRYILTAIVLTATTLSGADEGPVELPRELIREARAAGDTSPLTTFAEEAEQRGDFDLAADALAAALEILPRDDALASRLARNLYQTGAAGKPEAFRVADKLLAHSDNSDALLVRALIYLEQDLNDLAQADTTRLLAESPDSTPARLLNATLQLRQGKMLEAEQSLESIGPPLAGYDLEARDLLRRALIVFERERYTCPDSPEHHDAWARLLYRAARLPEAVHAARRACALDSGSPEKWSFLAAIWMLLGNREAALSAYEKAFALAPDDENLAAVITQLRQPAQ